MYNSHCIFQDMFSIPLTLLSFVLLCCRPLGEQNWKPQKKLRVRGNKALLLSRRRTQAKKVFFATFVIGII